MQTNSGWTVRKGGEDRAEPTVLPACLARHQPQIVLARHWMLLQSRHTSASLHSRVTEMSRPLAVFVDTSCSTFQNIFFCLHSTKHLQHKSILSDWLKRIWPLWLLADHQKIVFTTTLNTTLTLTNATLSLAVWANSVHRRRQVWDYSTT